MTLQAALIAAAPFILALLAISAVFSAAETALTGRQPRPHAPAGTRRRPRRGPGQPAAVPTRKTMIGAVLIGYNVLNILSSALATEFITQVVPGAWGVAIATAVMTVLVVVFVEVLPKTLAIVPRR
ncbi:MAG: CNNM domain-containing protein [Caulobacteraceae bacterium]